MDEQATNPSVESSWASTFAAARSEATSTRRKVRKGATPNEKETPELKEFQELADKLMEPKYWKALVRAPADIMLAKTGHRHWNLSESEAETLATTGSITVKAWLPGMDPKYLCLALFLSNVAFIYGTRFVEELRIARMEALEAMEKRELKP